MNFERLNKRDRIRRLGTEDQQQRVLPRHGFMANFTLGRKRAKALRIKRKGFGLPSSKAELRAIADQIAK